jgi:hypothetical protein
MIVDAFKRFSPFMSKSMQSFVPRSHGFLLMSTFIYDLKRVCMFRLSTQEMIVIGLGGHKQGCIRISGWHVHASENPAQISYATLKHRSCRYWGATIPIRSRVGTVLSSLPN